jgi:hypothetical protein
MLNSGSGGVHTTFTPTGRVGIGTTTPLTTLEVNGTLGVDGVSIFSSALGLGGASPCNMLHIYGSNTDAAYGPNIMCQTAADAYPQFQVLPFSHDNVSVNFDCYFDKTTGWTSSTSTTSCFQICKFGSALNFNYFGTGYGTGNAGTTISLATKMRLTGLGKIGIGNWATGAPAYDCDVDGTLRTTNLLVGDSTDSSRRISALNSLQSIGSVETICLGKLDSTNNQVELGFLYNAGGSATNCGQLGLYGSVAMYWDGNGNIGIGTAAPVCGLHIYKTTSISTGAGYSYLNSAGVSATNPSPATTSFSLKTNGRILCSGEIDIVSDQRVKRDIQVFPDKVCYDVVKKLQTKMFTKENDSRPIIGFLAQDVEKVIPQAVTQVKHEEYDDFRILNYSMVHSIGIGAIKELMNLVSDLRDEVSQAKLAQARMARDIHLLKSELDRVADFRGSEMCY